MPEPQSDHDVLIEVKTIQQVILQELKEIKDGTASRLSALETGKADKDYVMRISGKVTMLERAYWIAIGALAILQSVIAYYLNK